MSDDTKKERRLDSSPHATGGAGTRLEDKVATHFALGVLAQTEPRGLPGVVANEVAFQRARQGHPLDDIVVRGQAYDGVSKTLDVQVKRTIRFSEGDANFARVVAAIAETYKTDPADRNRHFAVALERTSGAIEHGAQNALELARSVETQDLFFKLLESAGRSNSKMRRFISEFRVLLENNGLIGDDVLFDIINRFSVIVFDYGRPGSLAEQYDRWRADWLAASCSKGRLYAELLTCIGDLNSSGGGKDRDGLCEILQRKRVRLSGAPALAGTRGRISEESRGALAEIDDTICGVALLRTNLDQSIEAVLDNATQSKGLVSIVGDGGVGKSAATKLVALRRMAECSVLVLSPDRVPSGGWSAYRHLFEIEADCRTFLQDLACDGGGVIVVDGLDRIADPGQQSTVTDLLQSALDTTGMVTVITMRPDPEGDSMTWLPQNLRAEVKASHKVPVKALDDEEACALSHAVPRLKHLLHPDHPAKELTRNPFILQRLASSGKDPDAFVSEAALAQDWWDTGGHGSALKEAEQRKRRRVLQHVAEKRLQGETTVDTAAQDGDAVSGLVADSVLVDPRKDDRVRMRHDLYLDWAIGLYLANDQARLTSLDLSCPPAPWLSRPVEIAFRIAAEDSDAGYFPILLAQLTDAAPAWRGIGLLALVRSERRAALLARFESLLFDQDGAPLADLLRRAMSAHSAPLQEIFQDGLTAGIEIPSGIVGPRDHLPPALAVWCAENFERLPPKALVAAVQLFGQLTPVAAVYGQELARLFLDRLTNLLVADLEQTGRLLPSLRASEDLAALGYAVGRDVVAQARQILAVCAAVHPPSAERYLRAIEASEGVSRHMHDVLEMPGDLPTAAPQAFCRALIRALEQDAKCRESHSAPFFYPEHHFTTGNAGPSTFLDILAGDRAAGIELVRQIVTLAEDWYRREATSFSINILGRQVSITSTFSYRWSRGVSFSSILSMSLMALETWGHEAIEAGEPVEAIVAQILGERDCSGALILVVVDLLLSHGSLDNQYLLDFLACPELLALDAVRRNRDRLASETGGSSQMFLSASETDHQLMVSLRKRKSRQIALHEVIGHLLFSDNTASIDVLRTRLEEANDRLGPWESDEVAWDDPVYMASHALLLADRSSYAFVEEADATGKILRGLRFEFPDNQERWLTEKAQESSQGIADFARCKRLLEAIRQTTNASDADLELAWSIFETTRNVEPVQNGVRDDLFDPWHARVAAAVCIARFGEDALIAEQQEGLLKIFEKALSVGSDKAHLFTDTLVEYDAASLAFIGLTYLAVRTNDSADFERLLSAVIARPQSTAGALRAYRSAAQDLGSDRLVSLVRAGIESSILPLKQAEDEELQSFETRSAVTKKRLMARKSSELAWLNGLEPQPPWPSLPPWPSKEGDDDETRDCFFDDRTAAGFLTALDALGSDASEPIRLLLMETRAWLEDTYAAENDQQDGGIHPIWLTTVFISVARHAANWRKQDKEQLVFNLMDTFNDNAFARAAQFFIFESDRKHIEEGVSESEYLAEVRHRIWSTLGKSKIWRHHASGDGRSINIFLRPLVATFFLQVDTGFGFGQSYAKDLQPSQVLLFVPTLTDIAIHSRNCILTAKYLLDVLDLIDPETSADSLLRVAETWALEAGSDFWNTSDLGGRVAKMLLHHPDLSTAADGVLVVADAIGAAGVSEATALRDAIAKANP